MTGATAANFPAIQQMRIGGWNTEAAAGNILIAAVWDSDLGDGIASLSLETGLSAWVAAAPDEGWRFDKTSTITPFVGTSTQGASTGATLDSGDAPAGWSDDLVTLQTIGPDANVSAGGWSGATAAQMSDSSDTNPDSATAS